MRLFPCSRCTGYRPILDAFKIFAKADPAAYTEESIAASKQPNGHLGNNQTADQPTGNGHGHIENGHTFADKDESIASKGHKSKAPDQAANGENGHSKDAPASKSGTKPKQVGHH